ncbi:hypothetical protein [Streptosporangium sp. NPDC006007]|uniref:hypothetical protein n=1 Tax=Streptosporangium sp. NPDC006007 TaxID=3154575 RepID=UPI0033A3C58C
MHDPAVTPFREGFVSEEAAGPGSVERDNGLSILPDKEISLFGQGVDPIGRNEISPLHANAPDGFVESKSRGHGTTEMLSIFDYVMITKNNAPIPHGDVIMHHATRFSGMTIFDKY